MTKTAPKLDIDHTRERLESLGLQHAAEHLERLLSAAVKEEVAPHVFVDRLLHQEIDGREERRIKSMLRLSGLPSGLTLTGFDFAFRPAVERSRIETLATSAWVRGAETVPASIATAPEEVPLNGASDRG